MNWVYIFLKTFFHNVGNVLPVLIILLIITCIGTIFFASLFKSKKIWFTLPGGAVFGTTLFTLFLGVFSYVFKGRLGIWIIFLFFILTGIFIYRKNRRNINITFPRLRLNTIFAATLVVIISAAIFVKSGNAIWGGDAITYWGFATSFANGNYPMVLPWQPQYLTVHHQGAFLFEGAVHALSGIDIRVVHFLFCAYIIAAGFFLLWGYLSVKTGRMFLSIAPSLFGYAVFGGLFILLPSLFFNSASIKIIDSFPILSNVKDALGALSNVPELYYLIPRTMSIAVIILIYILITEKIGLSSGNKLLLIASFSIVVLSTDESMFAAIILPVAGWVMFELIRTKAKGEYIKTLIFPALIFFALFWIVGNPIRDSILTPSPEAPRFQIVGLKTVAEQGRIAFLSSSKIIDSQLPEVVWYLPNYWVLLAAFSMLSLVSGGVLPVLFSATAVGTTFLYFFVDHTFWPGNYARFLLTGYQFIGFLYGIVIVYIFSSKTKLTRIVGIMLILLAIPGAFAAVISIKNDLKADNYSNFAPLTTRYKVLDWIGSNLPYNSRIFFIDGFLRGANYSDLTLQAIQGYGLFVPISSAKYKMHTAEYGVEAIDLIMSLSPRAMQALKIDYLYIQNGKLQGYSVLRRKEIDNRSYFAPVYSDKDGILYKINPDYFRVADEADNTINSLSLKIPDDAKIYIDSVPNLNFYVRAAVFLALKNKGGLYSVWGQGSYNYVETFINVNGPLDNIKYDYLVLGPGTKPEPVCDCKNFDKIWSDGQAIAYKILK